MDGVVSSRPRTDRPGAADAPRAPAPGVLLGPLRQVRADGVDRRQVEDVEAHGGDARQLPGDVGEGAVAAGRAGRAGEEFVPGAGRGQRRLDVDVELLGEAGRQAAVDMAVHAQGQLRVGRQGHRGRGFLCAEPGGEVLQQAGILPRSGGRGPLCRLAQQAGAVEKFDAHLLAGGGLLLQPFAPGAEVVDPGLDGVIDVRLFDHRDAGPPGVVAQRHHARLADLRLVRQPVAHHRLQGVVAVDEDVGGHGEHFPHRPFGREASPFHLRGEIFDDDSASAVGHGPFRPESGRSRPSSAAVFTRSAPLPLYKADGNLNPPGPFPPACAGCRFGVGWS